MNAISGKATLPYSYPFTVGVNLQRITFVPQGADISVKKKTQFQRTSLSLGANRISILFYQGKGIKIMC